MLQTSINSLLVTFTLATSFGVLVHDTKIDRAATLAITVPGALAAVAAIDGSTKFSEAHVHVERTSGPKRISDMRSNMPRLNPRDDEHPYFQSKKMSFGDADSIGLWPSV